MIDECYVLGFFLILLQVYGNIFDDDGDALIYYIRTEQKKGKQQKTYCFVCKIKKMPLLFSKLA